MYLHVNCQNAERIPRSDAYSKKIFFFFLEILEIDIYSHILYRELKIKSEHQTIFLKKENLILSSQASVEYIYWRIKRVDYSVA